MALRPDAYSAVCSLFATGLSDRAISRRTGVPQATVSRWRRSPAPPANVARAEMDTGWGISDPVSYWYLLGAYLGDGTVYHQAPRFWGLRIVTDRRYQQISDEVRAAMTRSLNSITTKLPSGRVAEYIYVRCFFSNYSADIRAIFREHCELLGVRVTQPSRRNLAISHRASVAIVEELVGAKH